MAGFPAYMRIRQYVLDLMREHRNIDVSIPSERELCRTFGVTRPTARKALKTLIEENYLYVKPGRGMFIRASQPETVPLRRPKRIMVVTGDGGLSCLDGFSMSILEKLCGTLKHLPVRLQVVPLDVDHDCALAEIEMYHPDGILWIRPGERGQKLMAEIRKKLPVIVLGAEPDGNPYSVTCDYREAGRLSAKWFSARRRKRTVFLQDCPGRIRGLVYDGWRNAFPEYDESLHFLDRFQEKEQNRVECLAAFLKSRNFDSIFTFGSYYPIVDAALTQTGKTGIPIVADNNFSSFYQVKNFPSAELRMFPPKIPEVGAKLMFRILDEPGFKPEKETILAPSIRAFPARDILRSDDAV